MISNNRIYCYQIFLSLLNTWFDALEEFTELTTYCLFVIRDKLSWTLTLEFSDTTNNVTDVLIVATNGSLTKLYSLQILTKKITMSTLYEFYLFVTKTYNTSARCTQVMSFSDWILWLNSTTSVWTFQVSVKKSQIITNMCKSKDSQKIPRTPDGVGDESSSLSTSWKSGVLRR